MARLSNKAYATPIPTFRLHSKFKMMIALLAFFYVAKSTQCVYTFLYKYEHAPY